MKKLLLIITCFLVQISHADDLSDAIHANDSTKVLSLLQQNKFPPSARSRYLELANEIISINKKRMLSHESSPIGSTMKSKYLLYTFAPFLLTTAAPVGDMLLCEYYDDYSIGIRLTAACLVFSAINAIVVMRAGVQDAVKRWKQLSEYYQ